MVKEELEMMAPTRLSEVEKAQQQMVELAMKLVNDGKLRIAGLGGEELV